MKLIKWRIDISKKGLEVPYIDEFYWTPLSIELSKNINETILFLKSLTDTEFLYTLISTISQKGMDLILRISREILMLMSLTKKENKVSLDNFIHGLVHLIDLYPNANYSKDEVCKKDKFIDTYNG